MKRRGQAAMEFLMTYGWAILVVLIAIGALAYFGVLNPSRFLPQSCTIVPGLSCDEHKVVSGTETSTVIVRNGMGADLTGVSVSITPEGGSAVSGTLDSGIAGDTCSATSGQIDDGAACQITFTSLTTGGVGSRFKGDITVRYTKDTLEHTATGSITTQIEAS